MMVKLACMFGFPAGVILILIGAYINDKIIVMTEENGKRRFQLVKRP